MKYKRRKILAAIAALSTVLSSFSNTAYAEDVISETSIEPSSDAPDDLHEGTTPEEKYCDQYGHKNIVLVKPILPTEWSEGRDGGYYCTYCKRWCDQVPTAIGRLKVRVDEGKIRFSSSKKGQLKASWKDVGHGCTYLVQCTRGLLRASTQDLRQGYDLVLRDGAVYQYSGKAVKPKILVFPDYKISEKYVFGYGYLKPKYYTVKYKNNIKPGFGTATVIGKGPFKSKIQKNFRIVDHKPNGLERYIYSVTYTDGYYLNDGIPAYKVALFSWCAKKRGQKEIQSAVKNVLDTIELKDQHTFYSLPTTGEIDNILELDEINRTEKNEKTKKRWTEELLLLSKSQRRELKLAKKKKKTVKANLEMLQNALPHSIQPSPQEQKVLSEPDRHNLYFDKGKTKAVKGNSVTFKNLKSGKKYLVRITVIYNGKKEGTVNSYKYPVK